MAASCMKIAQQGSSAPAPHARSTTRLMPVPCIWNKKITRSVHAHPAMDGWMDRVTASGAPDMAQETPTSINGLLLSEL